jgi:hypothetical protein
MSCSYDEDSNTTVTGEHTDVSCSYDEDSNTTVTEAVGLTADGKERKCMALHCVHCRRSLGRKP